MGEIYKKYIKVKKLTHLSRQRIQMVVIKKKELGWRYENCHIRIEIEGKSFKSIRRLLRNRINPAGKIYLDGTTLKRYRDGNYIIRGFVERKLTEYFLMYTQQRGLPSEPKPIIGYYAEKEGSFELLYDIMYDPILQTIIEGFVAGFTPWLMDKIYDLLKPDKDNDKNDNPNIKITNIIGSRNIVNL